MLTLDQARDIIAMLAPELVGVEVTAGVPELPAAAVAVHGVPGAAGPSIVFRGEPTVEHLLHEAAHLLPVTAARLTDESTPAVTSWYLQRAIETEPMTDDVPPWAGGHDIAFVRRCCHMAFRAGEFSRDMAEAVKRVPVTQSVDTLSIRLAHIEAVSWGCHGLDDYLHALGGEPRRCRTWPFAAIEAEPMPPCFVDLFNCDQATWLSHHTEELCHAVTR